MAGVVLSDQRRDTVTVVSIAISSYQSMLKFPSRLDEYIVGNGLSSFVQWEDFQQFLLECDGPRPESRTMAFWMLFIAFASIAESLSPQVHQSSM